MEKGPRNILKQESAVLYNCAKHDNDNSLGKPAL